MDKENKYYSLIENLVKNNKKFPGLEAIKEEIIDDVYSHSMVIIESVDDEDVINSYLQKVVSTSVITVPKKMKFNSDVKHRVITNTPVVKQTEKIPEKNETINPDIHNKDNNTESDVTEIESEQSITNTEEINNDIEDAAIEEETYNSVNSDIEINSEQEQQPVEDLTTNDSELPSTPVYNEKANPELVEKMINSIGSDEVKNIQQESPVDDIPEEIEPLEIITEEAEDTIDLSLEDNEPVVDIININDNIEPESIEEAEYTEILEPVDNVISEEELEEEAPDVLQEEDSALIIDTDNSDVELKEQTDIQDEDIIFDTTSSELPEEEVSIQSTELSEPQELINNDNVEQLIDYDEQDNELQDSDEPSDIEQDNFTENLSLGTEDSVDETIEPVTAELELDLDNEELIELSPVNDSEFMDTDLSYDSSNLISENEDDSLTIIERNNDDNFDVNTELNEFNDNIEDDSTGYVTELAENILTDDNNQEDTDIYITSTDNKVQKEHVYKPIDYSLFDYSPEKYKQSVDTDLLQKKLIELSTNEAELNILAVFDMKYKQNLSIKEIASELGTDEKHIIFALNKIIGLV